MKTKLLIVLSLAIAMNAQAGSATWNLKPATNDWNTATNWTPATVPNATTDTASLGASNVTSVFTSAKVDLGSLVFTAGAPSYTITVGTEDSETLAFWGDGVRNDSGVEQTIIAPNFSLFHSSAISFNGTSTAGEKVTYFEIGQFFAFNDRSSAGSAAIYVNSGGGDQGFLDFFDNSTAADATIILGPGTIGSFFSFNEGHPSAGNAHITLLGGDGITSTAGAHLTIFNQTIIDNGTFIAEPATVAGGLGATVDINNFVEDDLTGGTFVANGAAVSRGQGGTAGGTILVEGLASEGTYIINGATAAGGDSGEMQVDQGSAGAAFVTLNGGENGGPGGKLTLTGGAGGTARVAAYGNGFLNLNGTGTEMIGSIEGDGLVKLGSKNLTIGSNNLSTTFSGTIQENGSITKIGTGTLTLTGANTYEGGTTITRGTLLVSNMKGSGTGTGAVSVEAGTFGGSGIIAGAITIGTNSGTGAFLAPSKGVKKPATLTIQGALTLNDDSTYLYKLDTKRVKADEVIANGVVIDSGAKFSFRPSGNSMPTTGQVFTVISNTSLSAIAGTFHNLRDGAILTVNGSNLEASYTGGDGNDLILTVIP
jgi:autotransporter-associated beta strand protein